MEYCQSGLLEIDLIIMHDNKLDEVINESLVTKPWLVARLRLEEKENHVVAGDQESSLSWVHTCAFCRKETENAHVRTMLTFAPVRLFIELQRTFRYATGARRVSVQVSQLHNC